MPSLESSDVDSNYDELLHVAQLAARAGGKKLLEWRGKFVTREKSRADLVTDADLASQQAIAAVVSNHFPDHAFLGEENPGAASELLAQPTCWVVDPLDGTTNYVHGFPAFAVSVAVVVEGELVAGVVLNPLNDEVYSAVKHGGAWCNGKPIRVSQTASLNKALVALSLPPQASETSPDVLDFLALIGRCHGIRRTGSAALNLAFVARGVLDAQWARSIKAWDVAAGVLLVREAGGLVSASNGAPLDLANPHFVAGGTETLHGELVAVLAKSGASPECE